jgi:hypothetical protein
MRQLEHPTSQAGSRRVMGRVECSMFHICSYFSRVSRIFLIGAACALCAACLPEKFEWQGWVYPNRHALDEDFPLGRFASLADCRIAATRAVRFLQSRPIDGEIVEADYECGYRCKVEAGLGRLNVCERTEK